VGVAATGIDENSTVLQHGGCANQALMDGQIEQCLRTAVNENCALAKEDIPYFVFRDRVTLDRLTSNG
jgi:hypothetical protein